MHLHMVYDKSSLVGFMERCQFLFNLLKEREPNQSISHKRMPSWSEHVMFVQSVPYPYWYVIEVDGAMVGAIYLSHANEIGVGILRAHRRNGYARRAIQLLMEKHPGRKLANINPANEASLKLFHELGFRGPIQVTYEWQ